MWETPEGPPPLLSQLIVFLSTSLFAAYFVKLCKYFFSHMQHWNAVESEFAHLGFFPAPNYDSPPIHSHSQSLSEPLGESVFNTFPLFDPQSQPNPLSTLILACSEDGKPPSVKIYCKAYNTNSPKSWFTVILTQREDLEYPVKSGSIWMQRDFVQRDGCQTDLNMLD